jgi:hypothetical protein
VSRRAVMQSNFRPVFCSSTPLIQWCDRFVSSPAPRFDVVWEKIVQVCVVFLFCFFWSEGVVDELARCQSLVC